MSRRGMDHPGKQSYNQSLEGSLKALLILRNMGKLV